MKDELKISDTKSEIVTAAKACGVENIAIQMAKHKTGSNDREVIYQWIKDHKG